MALGDFRGDDVGAAIDEDPLVVPGLLLCSCALPGVEGAGFCDTGDEAEIGV